MIVHDQCIEQAKAATTLSPAMLWGVLIERLGCDIWWAQGFGKSLVNELSNEDLPDFEEPTARNIVSRIQELQGLLRKNC